MIELRKGPEPNVLRARGGEWHAELAAVLARGDKPTETLKARYRHPEIKNGLISETNGKCAYCESKLRHIAHGDIEHIRPKSKVPARAYDWQNLTLACDICNENKGDYLAPEEAAEEVLVDPYVDRPADHFLFLREIVYPRPDSLRGKKTDRVIKLSRLELLEKRRAHLDFIDGLVTAIVNSDDDWRPILLEDLAGHIADDKEYAGVSRAYLDFLKDKGVLKGD